MDRLRKQNETWQAVAEEGQYLNLFCHTQEADRKLRKARIKHSQR